MRSAGLSYGIGYGSRAGPSAMRGRGTFGGGTTAHNGYGGSDGLPKKKKNKGKKKSKKKKLGNEEIWRRSLDRRTQRLLNQYVGHFLSLIQQEFDDEVSKARDDILNKDEERLYREGGACIGEAFIPKAKGSGGQQSSNSQEVVDVSVKFNLDTQSSNQQLKHKPGDLVWLSSPRERLDKRSLPDAVNTINNGLVDQNDPNMKVLQGRVEQAGSTFLNVCVRCLLPVRGSLGIIVALALALCLSVCLSVSVIHTFTHVHTRIYQRGF